ncbi:MAG: MvaI/BcnI family restriction endonuclease [Ignavibacteriaceae bacterium]
MERSEAIEKIKLIIKHDLRILAKQYNVTVFKNEKTNKGWAGHVIERYLGLPINSAQSPNFGSWELKTICLKYLKDNSLTIKETMAITMIDPYNIERTEFESSHLLAKLKKIVIVARIWESQKEEKSILYATTTFDIGNSEIYNQVKADYDLVRETIIDKGFSALSGKLGVYIQPRTKGPGHGSTSRAFYARVPFLKQTIFPTLNQD